MKTSALRFRVDGNYFENDAFRTQWRHDNDYSPGTVFLLLRSVHGKHLMRFQSETSVFKFLRRSVDGALSADVYRFPCPLLFQAHMQARYVILRVLLEAGEKLVQLTSVTGADGKPDVLISLDRTKIESVGRPAIGNFLRKLQVHHHL